MNKPKTGPKSAKPKKPPVVADVAHPDTSAPPDTSKPIITHRPMIKDPMMVDDAGKAEIQAAEPKTEEKLQPSKPGGETRLTPLNAKADDKDGKEEDKQEPPADPEPAAPDTSAPDAPEPDGDAGEDKTKPLAAKEAKEAKAAGPTKDEEDAQIEKLVESRKYFLPINAVEHRRSTRFAVAGVILALILAVAWVDVALDAGLIRLGGVKPVTHLFSN